jgi:hypothetical protein
MTTVLQRAAQGVARRMMCSDLSGASPALV